LKSSQSFQIISALIRVDEHVSQVKRKAFGPKRQAMCVGVVGLANNHRSACLPAFNLMAFVLSSVQTKKLLLLPSPESFNAIFFSMFIFQLTYH